MKTLRIDVTRGRLAESVHRVSAVVVDADNRVIATAGDPTTFTFWRSAAKPFQAMPLVTDGAMERFGLGDDELALACASHSSEAIHLAAVDQFLAKVGVAETALACGPHRPLSADVGDDVVRQGVTMTPRWSNCSGKHTGMLALAKHHGWPLTGYQHQGHPVQDRILAEVERWTGIDRDEMELAVDGCNTVCFGLPLTGMALAYAHLGASPDPAPRRLWRAVTTRPLLVAGTHRVCSEVMAAWPGEIFAKIGAEGIYCAAIPSLRAGIALKIADGDMPAAGVALVAVVRQLLVRAEHREGIDALSGLGETAEPPIRTTGGDLVGYLRPVGSIEFS